VHQVLQYLKKHGEKLDSEIARDTGITLANVRLSISKLTASGEVIVCHSIRFEKGEKSEATLCRVAGYIPPVAPGRKPKA